MQRPTLEKLWMGDVTPALICGKDNGDIKHLMRLIENNRTKLKNGLNEKQIELLDIYDGCIDEYGFLKAEEAFSDGFSLGCKLMAEAFLTQE